MEETGTLFTPPERVIQLILDINEDVWKDSSVTERAIRELGDPPDCPPSNENGLYSVNLFRETGVAWRTFLDNWKACVYVHGVDATWKWDSLLIDPDHVRQRAGAIARPLGLRWQKSELGRQSHKQSADMVIQQFDQSRTMGMGQEFPMIAAIHDKWALCAGGEEIPFVGAPDLEVRPFFISAFIFVPNLGFYRNVRQVSLNAFPARYPNPYCGPGFLL